MDPAATLVLRIDSLELHSHAVQVGAWAAHPFDDGARITLSSPPIARWPATPSSTYLHSLPATRPSRSPACFHGPAAAAQTWSR